MREVNNEVEVCDLRTNYRNHLRGHQKEEGHREQFVLLAHYDENGLGNDS